MAAAHEDDTLPDFEEEVQDPTSNGAAQMDQKKGKLYAY